MREFKGSIYENKEPLNLFNVEKGKDIVCPNCKNSLIPFDGNMPVPMFQEIIHCSCGYDVSAILRSQAKGGELNEQSM
ncbi:hypothetical protein [Paenibacillus sp. GYB003]|uniref:hypothetical protein n=1 Tax=Paenibacillus sp. GYB003 TaxID=2994392 RepID=UPI002F967EC0